MGFTEVRLKLSFLTPEDKKCMAHGRKLPGLSCGGRGASLE